VRLGLCHVSMVSASRRHAHRERAAHAPAGVVERTTR
jgi:hypothetical protein